MHIFYQIRPSTARMPFKAGLAPGGCLGSNVAMVSHRKRKKEAARKGLNEPELDMLELFEEILERFRWLQILAHSQSFLLREKLKISDAELDRVLEAATRTVDQDASFERYQDGLARLKAQIVEGRRGIRRERKLMKREKEGRVESERELGGGASE